MSTLFIAGALAVCPAVPACSSRQMYASGQAYQRSECNRIESAPERAADPQTR